MTANYIHEETVSGGIKIAHILKKGMPEDQRQYELEDFNNVFVLKGNYDLTTSYDPEKDQVDTEIQPKSGLWFSLKLTDVNSLVGAKKGMSLSVYFNKECQFFIKTDKNGKYVPISREETQNYIEQFKL